MSYCTQSDLTERISLDELVALSDDANAGTVDVSVVARAIADADAEIDSYAAGRYSVPFATVPAMIRKISVELAVYNLYARRRGASVSVKERYDNSVRFLKSVANGEVTLGADAPAETASDHAPSFVSTDRIFGRDKMSGF